MIAKALLFFCLVAAANSTILKKFVGYQTPYVHYRHTPEFHEYVASPVVHKVVHPVHVENIVQPIVHTLYKSPVLHHSVETPTLEHEPAVIAEHVEPHVPHLAAPVGYIKKK
ncbi:hypothetical protein GE061_019711 [Apolygus lucorum]|uniref:Uncharacterized protein n=1 Tax=Apolygus lucorum TaxID=248454 RepID=A0A6A4J8X0_APOLU|nr:hypothetical protein GE061_019711 [Apolygus lucorum]